MGGAISAENCLPETRESDEFKRVLNALRAVVVAPETKKATAEALHEDSDSRTVLQKNGSDVISVAALKKVLDV